MPQIYTHYLVGTDALSLMDEALRSRIQQHLPYYLFGLQGPDFFFYYQVWPPRVSSAPTKAGHAMHNRHPNATFAAMLQYIQSVEGENKERLLAYLAGYLSHYALDSTAHPYVLANCGIKKNHTLFETLMDRQLLHERGIEPDDMPAYTLLMDGVSGRVIAPMIQYVLHAVFDTDLSTKQIEDAMASHRNVYRLMVDKTGRKRAVFRVMEKPFGRPLATMAIYPRAHDGTDRLNSGNKTWTFVGQGVERQESFTQLMQQAAQKSATYAAALYTSVDSGDIQQALDTFGDVSFAHGQNWKEDVPHYAP
ncbi:zinc dependent phospholipase C family protein [Eubacteriales bacterium OttesenSCG-928-N14]|nr:zinc dependent phospholipase C family protein [Eubacteriales bacterium OttesenSCG-928-N14]